MNSNMKIDDLGISKAQINNNLTGNAKKTLCRYFYLSEEFERIKSVFKLKHRRQQIFNAIFNMFPFKFSSPIGNPNFYHYACEAWILTILKQLQLDLSLAKNDAINFNDLMERIYELQLDEELYIENLQILLGTYKTSDHVIKITQTKLSQLFLNNIEKAKQLTIKKRISQSLSKANFEAILFLVLSKALNFTLNELNPREDDKSSLIILEVMIELRAKDCEENLSFEKFMNEVSRINSKKEKQETINKIANINPTLTNNVNLINSLETFYSFYSSSFAILLQDIHIFNLNSLNVISKIQYLIKHNLVKLKTYTIGFVNNLELNIRFRSIIEYLTHVYGFFIVTETGIIDLSKKNYNKMKNWITESYLFATSRVFIEESYYISKVYLYNRIVGPIKDVIILYKDSALNLLINLGIRTKEQIKAIFSYLLNFFGEEPFVKFSYDEDQKYLNIEINKHVYHVVNDLLINANFVSLLSVTDIFARFRKMISQ